MSRPSVVVTKKVVKKVASDVKSHSDSHENSKRPKTSSPSRETPRDAGHSSSGSRRDPFAKSSACNSLSKGSESRSDFVERRGDEKRSNEDKNRISVRNERGGMNQGRTSEEAVTDCSEFSSIQSSDDNNNKYTVDNSDAHQESVDHARINGGHSCRNSGISRENGESRGRKDSNRNDSRNTDVRSPSKSRSRSHSKSAIRKHNNSEVSGSDNRTNSGSSGNSRPTWEISTYQEQNSKSRNEREERPGSNSSFVRRTNQLQIVKAARPRYSEETSGNILEAIQTEDDELLEGLEEEKGDVSERAEPRQTREMEAKKSNRLRFRSRKITELWLGAERLIEECNVYDSDEDWDSDPDRQNAFLRTRSANIHCHDHWYHEYNSEGDHRECEIPQGTFKMERDRSKQYF